MSDNENEQSPSTKVVRQEWKVEVDVFDAPPLADHGRRSFSPEFLTFTYYQGPGQGARNSVQIRGRAILKDGSVGTARRAIQYWDGVVPGRTRKPAPRWILDLIERHRPEPGSVVGGDRFSDNHIHTPATEVCEECGAKVPTAGDLANDAHAESCSLHPGNVIPAANE